jgi:hypothetical protein
MLTGRTEFGCRKTREKQDERKAKKRLKAGGGSPPLKDGQNCEIALSNA